MDGQVQEVRRFLQRRRAVGDGGAGCFCILVEPGIDAIRQRQPVGRVHLGTTHVDDLLGDYFRLFFSLRNPRQHLLYGELMPLIAIVGEVGAVFSHKRYGSARTKQIHPWFLSVC